MRIGVGVALIKLSKMIEEVAVIQLTYANTYSYSQWEEQYKESFQEY